MHIMVFSQQVIHEGKNQTEQEIVTIAISYIRELDAVEKRLPVRRMESWEMETAESPNVKINFDAAFKDVQELWLGMRMGRCWDLCCMYLENAIQLHTYLLKKGSRTKEGFT